LTLLYLHAGFTNAHYAGILPRHQLLTSAIEFTVYKRQDISIAQTHVLTIELDSSSDAIDIVALTPKKRSLKRRIQAFFSPSKDVSNSPPSKHQQSPQLKTSAFKRLISSLTPTRAVSTTGKKVHSDIARTLFCSPRKATPGVAVISDPESCTSLINTGMCH
jgi:hypothetical protein